jgi:C1A family cysteine protease
VTPEQLDIKALKTAIAEEGALWEAGETDYSSLSADEQNLLLGYTPGPEDPSLEESERMAEEGLKAFMALEAAEIAYPASYDLRNVGGNNFITPVKNQGGCGSCVAFGVAATVEGAYRRLHNNPNLAVDYSEAHLFYCHARAEGRRCNNGWWTSKALDAFRDKGVVDEACYPYTAGDQDCTGLCADAQNRLTKITGWKRLTSVSEMKDWISTKGPLAACFTVYQDFFNYKSGVYKHISGQAVGGHCVCCVGYNDSQKYWIMKNSWGNTFGESGYFRIAYGQCGIDSFMDVVEGVGDLPWQKNKRITGLWAINQNRNAWVYVQGMGWFRVSPDNDNIFFDMLSQLIAAKAGQRRVDFYQENRVIKQVYVF